MYLDRYTCWSFQETEGTHEFFADCETLKQLVQRTEIFDMWCQWCGPRIVNRSRYPSRDQTTLFPQAQIQPYTAQIHNFSKRIVSYYRKPTLFEAPLRAYKFVILTDHKPLLTFMQRTPDSQKLRRWQDLLMTFDCTTKHTARKDYHITDALSRMHKYAGVSNTKDNLIPYVVDSTSIRPLQEITSKHMKLSDYSTISSPTLNHPDHNMPSCGDIKSIHVDCDLNNCRGRAGAARHHHSSPYLNEADMETSSNDD